MGQERTVKEAEGDARPPPRPTLLTGAQGQGEMENAFTITVKEESPEWERTEKLQGRPRRGEELPGLPRSVVLERPRGEACSHTLFLWGKLRPEEVTLLAEGGVRLESNLSVTGPPPHRQLWAPVHPASPAFSPCMLPLQAQCRGHTGLSSGRTKIQLKS